MKILFIVLFMTPKRQEPDNTFARLAVITMQCSSNLCKVFFLHISRFKFWYKTKRTRILHMPFLFRCGIWLWGWEEGYFFMVVFSWVSGWGSELSSSTADCGAESHKLEEKFVRVRNCTDITILVRNISNCWVVWISRWSPPTDHWPTKCLV